MALYKAIRDGLVGTSYIRAGEIFSLDAERDPSWAVRVEDPLEGIEKGEPEDDSAPEDNEEQEAKPAPKSKKAKGK